MRFFKKKSPKELCGNIIFGDFPKNYFALVCEVCSESPESSFFYYRYNIMEYNPDLKVFLFKIISICDIANYYYFDIEDKKLLISENFDIWRNVT